MGLLVNGEWHTDWYDTEKTGGEFVRDDPGFLDWIVPEGESAPDGRRAFPAEAGRYHLYVSYACPWAHRTLIVRHLKGLEDLITVSVVDAEMRTAGHSQESFPRTMIRFMMSPTCTACTSAPVPSIPGG